MKDCPKCGFLNADRSGFCMKCRFQFVEAAPPVEPASPDLDGGHGAMLDEPPSWAQEFRGERDMSPLMAPAPDLDDAFAGRSGMTAGGYGIDGSFDGPVSSSPAPGDAYAIMTGSDIHQPYSLRDKGKKRKQQAAKAPKRKQADKSLSRKLEKQLRGQLPPPSQAAPMAPPPAMMPQMQQPPMMAPPTMQQPPMMSALVDLASEPSWAAASADAAVPGAVRRPLPRTQIPAAAPPRPRRELPSLPSVDLSVLARVRDISARLVLTIIVSVLVLAAIIYAFTGAGFFARPQQGNVDAAVAAMTAQTSYHLTAAATLTSSTLGAVGDTLQADVARNGDVNGFFSQANAQGQSVTHVIRVAGKAYTSVDGGPWSAAQNFTKAVDLSGVATLAGVSVVRMVDQPVIDGVTYQHLAYSGGETLLASLFPRANVPETASVRGEAWIDSQTHLIKRLVLWFDGLSEQRLGNFSGSVELLFSGFGAPLQIASPM